MGRISKVGADAPAILLRLCRITVLTATTLSGAPLIPVLQTCRLLNVLRLFTAAVIVPAIHLSGLCCRRVLLFIPVCHLSFGILLFISFVICPLC